MILKNCSIITQNSNRDIIPRGFLVIKNDKIIEIGNGVPKKKYRKEEVLNLENKTILPGFINTHCHLGDLIYKENIDKIKSPKNILEITNNFDSKISEKKLEIEKQKSCLRTLAIHSENGVTTLAGGRGMEEAPKYSIRFLGGKMITGKESILHKLNKIKEECNNSSLLFPGILLHSLLEIPLDNLSSFKKIADISDFTLMLHLAEFPEEKKLVFKKHGKERIDLLQELGILSKERKTILVHGNFLEEKEIRQLSKYNVGFSLCPTSSKKFNFKTVNLKLLEKYGVKKSIATDGPLTNPELNLIKDTQLFNNQEKVSSQKALDYITIEAAQVLGVDEVIGSLEPGKFADILVLDDNQSIGEIFKNKDLKISFVIKGGKIEYKKTC